MNFRLIGSIAAFLLLASSFSAQAAHKHKNAPIYKAPPPVVRNNYDWTGLYAGINAGYGAGSSNWGNFATSTLVPAGWVGGGTLGFNYQIGNAVLGIEGDYDFSKIKGFSGSGLCVVSFNGCVTSNTWLSTIRGRFGYAYDRFLPYVTGGLAYGNIKATRVFGSESATEMGYALGAGLEYAFSDGWSTKVEYLYVKLSDGSCNLPCGSPAIPVAVTFSENLIRVGLNYKFGGSVFGSR